MHEERSYRAAADVEAREVGSAVLQAGGGDGAAVVLCVLRAAHRRHAARHRLVVLPGIARRPGRWWRRRRRCVAQIQEGGELLSVGHVAAALDDVVARRVEVCSNVPQASVSAETDSQDLGIPDLGTEPCSLPSTRTGSGCSSQRRGSTHRRPQPTFPRRCGRWRRAGQPAAAGVVVSAAAARACPHKHR